MITGHLLLYIHASGDVAPLAVEQLYHRFGGRK
jgi:hypothetical protein